MANNEENIKAFFSNEENIKKFAEDKAFMKKVEQGQTTNKNYTEKFKEFGFEISDTEAEQDKEDRGGNTEYHYRKVRRWIFGEYLG